jgi:hypothetical protein
MALLALSFALCCARVAAASLPLGFAADSGDKKFEELSSTRDDRLALKLRVVGEAGIPDLSTGDFMLASFASIWFCIEPEGEVSQMFYQANSVAVLAPHSRTEKSRHRIGPGHLLQDRDEKSDLNLSRML